MKKILGLDLGTNSIGWALIEHNFETKKGGIEGMGSRIIPMGDFVTSKTGSPSKDPIKDFASGVGLSKAKARTTYRGVRRLYQRDNLRRERLHRVLNVLGFLPTHYADAIDFKQHLGQFKKGLEPKLNYKKNGNGKHEFIFKSSFEEMVKEFEAHGNSGKIPYDWTLYYLRKKALTQKITKEELAWILLNFNQKRGYYQLRGEEEPDNEKHKEFCTLSVKEVIDSEDEVKGKKLYDVIFTNDWKYDKQVVKIKDWIGKTKEFIVTTTTNKDGSIKRIYKAVDSEKDWIAIKKRTEQDIGKSEKTVGQYIYDALLKNPSQKIRGKLIKTIERKFYRTELEAILDKQLKEHTELLDKTTYSSCIRELYPRNEAHQNNIKDRCFKYLFVDDIIFYQRPLKSKKSTISGCNYEFRSFVDKEDKMVTEPIKAIPKSHPLYQEFRLWQFLRNLKVIQKENERGYLIDEDVTDNILKTEESWVELYEHLNSKKEINQKQFIGYLVKNSLIPKANKTNYRWNYVEDKEYPCSETMSTFVSRLKKIPNLDITSFLSPEVSQHLWHIIYSVKDIKEFETALGTFASKHSIDKDVFVESFKKFPPFISKYGAYSLKAIKKLLPLMRRGKYWKEDEIATEVKERISAITDRLKHIGYDPKKINDHIVDDDIPQQLLKSFIEFQGKNPTQGLNTYQACYAVYDRHSETSNIMHWHQPEDIASFLNSFKQHSLRNPIVEQVVIETLRTVKDIWEKYGEYQEVDGKKIYAKLFDEIHLELGREMKNSAAKRKSLTDKNSENENTNHRIRKILEEMQNDPNMKGDIRPYSPSHQELLKIYEEGISQNPNPDFSTLKEEDVTKIRKNVSPSSTEITKYKLWMEQGYASPYTGKTIPLSRLFTTDYQIEHIIPQSRYFDNSISNKVICESAVNAEKSNMTAYEFMKNTGGQMIALGQTNNVSLFNLGQYEQHCNYYFKKNKTKLKNLLSEEIPEGFINRQLNDSRYISTFIKGLLCNLVREDKEQEATSKHLLPTPGAITAQLKKDWGLNDKWNEIVAPRFKRLNDMTNSEDFGKWDDKINAFRTNVPEAIKKGFNKKRIDHRHHALDALVIACCTRNHVNYLNALSTKKKNSILQENLLVKNKQGDFTKHFKAPWSDFTSNAKTELYKIIISFKQNQRVINKTNNKTWQWVETNGQLKKQLVPQTKGDNWAIRKPLHKETVSGKVSLRRNKYVPLNSAIDNREVIVNERIKLAIEEIVMSYNHDLKKTKDYFKKNPILTNGEKISKIEIYEMATAVRTALSEKFTRKHLEHIADAGIRQILSNHLQAYIDEEGKECFDLAFNPEGIDELNKNIISLNNGKFHHPIRKVRMYEVGTKFKVGITGNKKDKYVEAAQGTNLFFAIYWDEDKQVRTFQTIPLNEVIEHQKQVALLPTNERTPVPMNTDKGIFLYTLSPNDLVYVPTDEEVETPSLVNFKNLTSKQADQVYKMVSCSGNQCFFTPNKVAKPISNKFEFSALNKMEKSVDEIMIKKRCWKLQIDRLGNVVKVIKTAHG